MAVALAVGMAVVVDGGEGVLAFPPLDVGGGNFTVVLEVA